MDGQGTLSHRNAEGWGEIWAVLWGWYRADIDVEVLRDVLQDLPFASLFECCLDLVDHRGKFVHQFVHRTPLLHRLLNASCTVLEGIGGHVSCLTHGVAVDVLDDVAKLSQAGVRCHVAKQFSSPVLDKVRGHTAKVDTTLTVVRHTTRHQLRSQRRHNRCRRSRHAGETAHATAVAAAHSATAHERSSSRAQHACETAHATATATATEHLAGSAGEGTPVHATGSTHTTHTTHTTHVASVVAIVTCVAFPGVVVVTTGTFIVATSVISASVVSASVATVGSASVRRTGILRGDEQSTANDERQKHQNPHAGPHCSLLRCLQ